MNLQVANADGAADRCGESARSCGSMSAGTDCHTRQRERTLRLELLPQSRRAEPAVLVVDARDAARVCELDGGAHRIDVLAAGIVR